MELTTARERRHQLRTGTALPPTAKCTDLANAERFAAAHGADLRYVPAWRRWLVWTAARWQQDETGEVMRRAKLVAKSLYMEAAGAPDDASAKAIGEWAQASQSRSRLEAMLALAQSEHPLPATHDSFDTEAWVLNTRNVTVDLHNGETRPHDRGDLITKITGTEYPTEPGDDAPIWTEFLSTIFGGNHALIAFVQRILGSALPGIVLEHILPIFHGTGANGKSVLIETVMAVLGEYALKAPAGLLMTSRNERHPTELADLFGKRLVVISETADGQRLDERLVKETSGGDTIRARRMREDFWSFAPSHLAVLVTNHLPVVRGNDHGIWRRVKRVPFAVTIPAERQDKRLVEKLRGEHPAILRWLVEGCLAWQREGLREPAEVMAATGEYQSESDVIAPWLDERCTLNSNATSTARELYADYRRWCEANHEHALSQRRFGQRLVERRFTRARRGAGFYYAGIGLLQTTYGDK